MKIKQALLATVIFSAILSAASPVLASSTTYGTTYNGSLETIWSSDLGSRASQLLHPTVATPGNGTTNPSTPDSDYLFANQNVTVSLATSGLSGVIAASTPASGDINGKLWHAQVALQTPAVGYYGMGMGSVLGGRIYVSGVDSGMLYYGLHVSESTTGGADGGNTGNNHTLFAQVTDNPSILRFDSNYSFDQFGTTNVKTWLGGSVVNTRDGNGFVGFDFQPASIHSGGGTGPGQFTTFDLWLTLSDTPLSAMPSVPVPAAAWLLGSGLLGLMGVARRKLIA